MGSGPKPRNIFNADKIYGVDIRPIENENVSFCMLGFEKLPFPDNTFDILTAFDVLEHIPRLFLVNDKIEFPVIYLFNEIWRVLKPSGLFFSLTPCYPFAEAFQDPTHVNIMTEDTIRLYFCNNNWARIYGFKGFFSMIDEGWDNSHYWAILRKEGNIGKVDFNQKME